MVETKERLLGPYRLVREAGRGGMATVYEAVDTRDERTVAVKVLSLASEQTPEERQKQLSRLRREAMAISRLQHPNIVALYDFVIAEDTPESPTRAAYIVMEYVDGETLRQRLRRTGPIPPAEAIDALEQIASALDAVHAAGIVHRDLKPSNIMLLPDGTAKLMDFGVARLEDDTKVTRTGMVVGSPAYMSPEQATGQKVTPVSDVWSLAAVFFEMLAGYTAFKGDNIPAVLYQVAFGEPAPLPDTTSETQPIFNRFSLVFEQAFARDTSARFRTASAMAAAFRAALEAREVPVVIPAPLPRETPTPKVPVPTDVSETDTVFAAALKRSGSVMALPAVLGMVFLLGIFWPRGRGADTPTSPAAAGTSAPVSSVATNFGTPAAPVRSPIAVPGAAKPTVLSPGNALSLSAASAPRPTSVKPAPTKPTPTKPTPKTTAKPAPKTPTKTAAKSAISRTPVRAARPRPSASFRTRKPPPRGKAKGWNKSKGRGNGRGRGQSKRTSAPPFPPKTVLIPGR